MFQLSLKIFLSLVALFSFSAQARAQEAVCTLNYQRVKGAGQKLSNRQDAMPMESVSFRGKEVVKFETDWLWTSGKRAEGNKRYGSHNRLVHNPGNNLIRLIYNVGPAQPPAEKLIYPQARMEFEGDLVKASCEPYFDLSRTNGIEVCPSDTKHLNELSWNPAEGSPSRAIYDSEVNLMSKLDSPGQFSRKNAYIFAKLAEMMYEERLDYQLRFKLKDLTEDQKKELSQKSSKDLEQSRLIRGHHKNFECAYRNRFAHYFHDLKAPSSVKPRFRFMNRTMTQHLMGAFHYTHDPELMIITTPQANFLIWRGTDNTQGKGHTEWVSTDFAAQPKLADSPELKGVKVHAGFWDSMRILDPDGPHDLTRYLDRYGDGKRRPLWIAGHSLGGAKAILSATYLAAKGYRVNGVYTYAAPRVLGDKAFQQRANSLLRGRIYRTEFAMDFVTKLWMAGYEMGVGERYWLTYKDYRKSPASPAKLEEWVFREKLGERQFPYTSRLSSEIDRRLDMEAMDGGMVSPLGVVAGGAAAVASPILAAVGAAAGAATGHVAGAGVGAVAASTGGIAVAGLLPVIAETGWMHNPHPYVFGTYAAAVEKNSNNLRDLPAPIDPFPHLTDAAPSNLGYK